MNSTALQIDIITLFPAMFDGPFSDSIIKRAQDQRIVKINIHNLRNWAEGKRKQVDDTPYGGGGGMVIMIDPVAKAIKDIKQDDSLVIATTAKGKTFTQSLAKELAGVTEKKKTGNQEARELNGQTTKQLNGQTTKQLVIICGHYEGFDQRILDELVDLPISIGNYVLTGGEIPAMVIVDSVVRLIPGVVGNETTLKTDSFYEDDEEAQYPIYTKPEIYTINGKEIRVPKVLLSGDHEAIADWRMDKSGQK